MLSNTAETKPRPNVVCHDAGGSCSTGIIDAASTSDSRNTAPRAASGSSSQSGRRIGAVQQDHDPHRDADERETIRRAPG